MKKKIVLILAVIIFVALIIGTMYYIDMNRINNNRPVVFSTWGYDYAPPEKVIESQNNYFVNEYTNFDIVVKKAEEITKKKVLGNKELNQENEDYDLYYYGLSEVNVKADNEIISLEEALKTKKITLEKIIEKAKEDKEVGKIMWDGYYDGGTTLYKYETYTIMKLNTIEGDKNLWIGIPEINKETIYK